MDCSGFSSLYTRRSLTTATIVAFALRLGSMSGLAVIEVDGDYVQRVADINSALGW